jgi:hypothetical protein
MPEAQPRACLIMLNAGQVSRVGPQRLYVKMARTMVKRGIAVLRFDFAGVGDSQAENEAIHFDNHATEEVAAAARYVRDVVQVQVVALQGLCAGARAALKYAALDEHIDGVLALSCPIFTASDTSPRSTQPVAAGMSRSRARHRLSRVATAIGGLKFLSWRWWRNRVSHRGPELRELGSAIRQLVLPGGRLEANEFLQGTDSYLRNGRKVLFVYGERDKIPLAEFRERYPGVAEGSNGPQSYQVITHGTHTFASVAAQLAVIDTAVEWVAELATYLCAGGVL